VYNPRMSQDDIKQLTIEIQSLKAQVTELQKTLDSESRDTTSHIKEIHKLIMDCNDRIVDLGVFVGPLVHKNFPGYAEDAEKLDTLNKGSIPPRIDRWRTE
jgi:SMC interacting uncharacterized protein involved in chromosome segregation